MIHIIFKIPKQIFKVREIIWKIKNTINFKIKKKYNYKRFKIRYINIVQTKIKLN